ncbi:hypothetical protein HUA76_02165 [Myxococcus sp. CA056]|uniref:hypothetical protein n=1 Tax=Myxococcus sp. CA056 TaxID=2741740 RepID=UPI00157BA98A|nr:hypothetical protein [Myxococcus sp. CA056]NTX09577.1 hypothetical protein [Myxococcus sp. CA056]
MRCLLLAVGLVAIFSSNACAPRVTRPSPALGQVADVRTKPGRYDGYSVAWRFEKDAKALGVGLWGGVELHGQGRRPIVVWPRAESGDPSSDGDSGPALRIDSPMVTRSSDPRVREFLSGRIEGLDYEYMKAQGWLYERCGPPFVEPCVLRGTFIKTSSFESVDPLIAYLGRWLKEGDYAGVLHINVVQHVGVPEDIRTRMGDYDGYSVDLCKPEENPDRRLIVVTGQGSRVFAPFIAGEPEDYDKRRTWAVLIGGPDPQARADLTRPGCHAPHAARIRVVGYEDVDAAIAYWGGLLKAGNHQGEVLIYVQGLAQGS